MFATRTLLTATLTTLGLTMATGTAEASHRHIDNLALRLQRQVRELTTEVRAHYRHTPQYRHLISDAGAAYRLAAHIHSVAHMGGSARHMDHDLDRLDDLYHHMVRLISRVEHDARYHGHGHVHGDTRHVRGLLASIHRTLMHLHNDVNELMHRFDRHHGHGHGHGVHGHHGRTIRIGGTGISFRFGF